MFTRRPITTLRRFTNTRRFTTTKSEPVTKPKEEFTKREVYLSCALIGSVGLTALISLDANLEVNKSPKNSIQNIVAHLTLSATAGTLIGFTFPISGPLITVYAVYGDQLKEWFITLREGHERRTIEYHKKLESGEVKKDDHTFDKVD
jgi:hypothetical protein